MFFILSKILSFLIDPLFWILTLFILSIVLKKTYKQKRYFIAGLAFLLLFSNGFLFNFMNEKWEIKEYSSHEQFDYGILLGGMISLNSTEENIQFLQNNDRLLNTIELYKTGIVKNILITGASGSMTSEMKEADILKSFLIKIGVPKKRILIEDRSKNTYENAIYTANKLNELHPENDIKCLIITSNYHMRRSLGCFNKTDLFVFPFIKKPTPEKLHFDLEHIIIPQSHTLFNWKVLLHEIIGYYTYKFMGYL